MNLTIQFGRSRPDGRCPKGEKVRAPQGMVLDNVQRGDPGKCHREVRLRSFGEGGRVKG